MVKKKNNIFPGFIVSLFVILLFHSSCEKEENIMYPDIYLINEDGYVSSDTNIAAGDEIRVKLELAKGDNNITNFLIIVDANGEESRYFDTGMNTPYLIWEGVFIKTLAEIEEWQFVAYDRKGNASSVWLNISLDTSGGYNMLIDHGQLSLGAQENAQDGGCYDIAEQKIYNHQLAAQDTSIQSGIDLIYYYRDIEDFHTIASSGANIDDGIFPVNPTTWDIRNTSRFLPASITAEDFNLATNDSIILANYNEGEAKRKAKNLSPGDIYTFRTQEGRLGMFMVENRNGTAEGNIVIKIKTQP